MFQVLIESDWNLKQFGGGYNPPVPDQVLIESDWNLK